MIGETFWWLLVMGSLAWYAVVTVYVAVRGVLDIRGMLARLAGEQSSDVD